MVALDYEIAQEQASALGRLGRALEVALAALSEHDRGGQMTDDARAKLMRDAGQHSCTTIASRKKCKIAWEFSAEKADAPPASTGASPLAVR